MNYTFIIKKWGRNDIDLISLILVQVCVIFKKCKKCFFHALISEFAESYFQSELFYRVV